MIRRMVVCLLLTMLLTGCTRPAPSQDPPPAPMAVADTPPSDSAPKPPPAPAPVPASAAWVRQHPLGPAVSKSETGTRLSAAEGVFYPYGWAAGGRFLAGYVPPHSSDEVLLLVDAEAERLVQVTVGRHGHLGPSPDQRYTLIRGGRATGPTEVKVVDTESGQIVFTHPVESRQAEAQWIGPEHFVVTDFSATGGGVGRVMVASLKILQSVTLSTAGRLVAAMPDGHLLIRQGPVDGPLVLFAPPYTKPPVQIAAGGVLRRDFAASHAGRHIAWQEAAAVVIWDQQTRQTTLIPFPGSAWNGLLWSRDGTHLLAGNPDPANPGRTNLSRLYTRGHQTVISAVDWVGALQAVAETAEGDIAFSVFGKKGEKWRTLLVRAPNGDLKTLEDSGPGDWTVDAAGRLITWRNGMTRIHDLRTGSITHTKGKGHMVSPEGHYLLVSDLQADPRVIEALFLTSP